MYAVVLTPQQRHRQCRHVSLQRILKHPVEYFVRVPRSRVQRFPLQRETFEPVNGYSIFLVFDLEILYSKALFKRQELCHFSEFCFLI